MTAPFRDDEPQIQQNAVISLDENGDSRAIEALIAALKDRHWQVRCVAAGALRHLNDPRAVEPLIAALQVEKWEVQSRVAVALCRSGNATGMQAVAEHGQWHALFHLEDYAVLDGPRVVERSKLRLSLEARPGG